MSPRIGGDRPPPVPGSRPGGRARWRPRLAAVVAVAALAAACTGAGTGAGGEGDRTVEVWSHADSGPLREAIEARIDAFNVARDDVLAVLRLLPEGSYADEVLRAAEDGTLPDLLDLDPGLLWRLAADGHLTDLTGLLPDALRRRLLPTAYDVGVFAGRLVGVPVTERVTVLLADRDALEAARVRIPASARRPWTAEELTDVLARLAPGHPAGVLDLRLGPLRATDDPAWAADLLAALARTAGGGVTDALGTHATDVLNGPETTRVVVTLREWADAGWVVPDAGPDALIDGTVAMVAGDTLEEARLRAEMGDRLVVLPLPTFGTGPGATRWGWSWAVPRGAVAPATEVLLSLFHPESVAALRAADPGVPVTREARQLAVDLQPPGPRAVIGELVDLGAAVPPPRTPRWRDVATEVAAALTDALSDGAVYDRLTGAAARIDELLLDG